jgi:hypothetical protein
LNFPELEDQLWFPSWMRRMQTEYIGWLVHRFGVYGPLAPVLADMLERAGVGEVTDLGAGSGGPSMALAQQKALTDVSFVLTDLFPSPSETGSNRVRWHHEPVDALAAPIHLSGLRTMFNAFHHFEETDKQKLLAGAGKHGLFVAEVLQPDVWCFLKIAFTTTVGQVLLAPFVRPFRWERLLFTWILPVNLVTVTWDGLASVTKVDAPARMFERARLFAPEGCTTFSGMSGYVWAPVAWFCVLPATAGNTGDQS